MESKICTQCKIEKHINDFYNKYTESDGRSCKRGLKRYYENKDKISNQQKIYYEKNRNKLLQKQKNGFKNFKEKRRSYVESGNRLKAMEEKLTVNDSENN